MANTKLKSLWDNTEAADPFVGDNNQNVPDGSYEARPVSYELAKQLKITWRIVKGPSKDEELRQRFNLDSKGISYLKRQMVDLGFEDVGGDDIEEALEELVNDKPKCIINVATKDNWQNTYLNERLEWEETDEEDDDEGSDEGPEDDADDEEEDEEEAEVSDEEDEGEEWKVGDDIQWRKGRKTFEGTIKSIDEDEGTAKVKVPGQRKLEEVYLEICEAVE